MGLESLGPYVQHERSRRNLYLAASASSLLYISTGTVMAWASPAEAALHVSEEELMWLGSLYAIGAALGPMFNGFLLDRIGRKWVLVLMGLFFLVHWAILGVTVSRVWLYTGRVIGGLGVGGSFAGVSLYIAEIADEGVRGSLGSMNQFFLSVGFLVEYILLAIGVKSGGTLACVGLGVGLATILALLPLPESPLHLLAKGKRASAHRALSWIRAKPPPFAVQRELDAIQESLEEDTKGSWSELWVGKTIWICFLIMFTQQITGMNAIVAYEEDISDSLGVDRTFVPLLLGTLNLFASAWAPFLVNRFGLKRIFILSALLITLSLLLLASHFFATEYGKAYGRKIDFLLVVSLVVYNTFFCIGLGPTPWTIAGEMFPSRLKGRGLGILALVTWLLTFLVVWGYKWSYNNWGPAPILTTFAALTFFSSLPLICLLPDTRSLTLQDIQDLLNGPPPKSNQLED